jgi:GNAT superfamily N-acetyltransferase
VSQHDRSIRIRPLEFSDIIFADAIRAAAGWNQTPQDWQRFLTLSPEGCFLAECDGSKAGTATTLIYGGEVGWIGMVLVHPDFRRRGIGTALLTHCIEYLRSKAIRSIKLDATPAGREVYLRLGFKDEWALSRWSGVAAGSATTPTSRVREFAASDMPEMERLDVASFGIDRRELLQALTIDPVLTLAVEDENGVLAGYGLARQGSRRIYLGPMAAYSPKAGITLVRAMMDRLHPTEVYWDIPDGNRAATALAAKLGFRVERALTRMVLGENAPQGDAAKQFAIAGPELG